MVLIPFAFGKNCGIFSYLISKCFEKKVNFSYPCTIFRSKLHHFAGKDQKVKKEQKKTGSTSTKYEVHRQKYTQYTHRYTHNIHTNIHTKDRSTNPLLFTSLLPTTSLRRPSPKRVEQGGQANTQPANL